MTKRDFEFIAGVIRELHGETRSVVARHFSKRLSEQNPRFNRGLFLAACQRGDEDVAGQPLPVTVDREGEF